MADPSPERLTSFVLSKLCVALPTEKDSVCGDLWGILSEWQMEAEAQTARERGGACSAQAWVLALGHSTKDPPCRCSCHLPPPGDGSLGISHERGNVEDHLPKAGPQALWLPGRRALQGNYREAPSRRCFLWACQNPTGFLLGCLGKKA